MFAAQTRIACTEEQSPRENAYIVPRREIHDKYIERRTQDKAYAKLK